MFASPIPCSARKEKVRDSADEAAFLRHAGHIARTGLYTLCTSCSEGCKHRSRALLNFGQTKQPPACFPSGFPTSAISCIELVCRQGILCAPGRASGNHVADVGAHCSTHVQNRQMCGRSLHMFVSRVSCSGGHWHGLPCRVPWNRHSTGRRSSRCHHRPQMSRLDECGSCRRSERPTDARSPKTHLTKDASFERPLLCRCHSLPC